MQAAVAVALVAVLTAQRQMAAERQAQAVLLAQLTEAAVVAQLHAQAAMVLMVDRAL
jgi:hypothetical protein